MILAKYREAFAALEHIANGTMDPKGYARDAMQRCVDMGDGSERPLDRNFLREVADAVKAKLPDNYGFIVLATPFGKGGDGRLVYTANIQRPDAINTLKELLLKAGAAEDWMKHIK